uniref:Inhibitory synaptic factor 2A n=1 Tax=Phocoena sinus TaxID=42100 RepID=A0A8C9BS73_PHOSS
SLSKENECIPHGEGNEVEPAACLALEMKYALDPNRQIKKRNKALQVRFKDICEAQNEQRDTQLSSGQLGDKPASYRATYRKYMTVPARRSIPNVTKSTVCRPRRTLRSVTRTFPLDRKKGNLKGIPAKTEERPGEESRQWARERAGGQPAGVNCAELHAEPPTCTAAQIAPLQNSTRPPSQEPDYQLHGKASTTGRPQYAEEPAASAHGTVFKTEVATVYGPAPGARAPELALSNSAPSSEWSLCPWPTRSGGRPHRPMGSRPRPAACPGLLAPRTQCLSPECSEASLQTQPPRRTSTSLVRQRSPWVKNANKSASCEVVDLKAQLQMMENLISSSQETIKVLLGVIQELEKGEAHREGLSYRTGQDTANCDTCRNSACIIYSVELDFKQQEDKLQPVLRKLHPFEETQVAHSPYAQETYSTPKQKPKTESKKHGRWKLWFL